MAAQRPPRPSVSKPAPKSQSQSEESVYALGMEPVTSVAPRIRNYNIAPPPVAAGQGPAGPAGPNAGLPPTPKARTHQDSSQMENIFNPVRGPRDAQIRAGIKPVNHARANAHAIKEQSELNALRKMSTHSDSVPKLPPVRSTSAPSQRHLQRISSDGRDFVNENKLGAVAPVRAPRADKRDDDGKYLVKKDYGKVPQYLMERKMEMVAVQEAKERAKEAAMIPPGMRLLPEEERLETLAILSKNREEVERALQGLPLRIETPSAIRRKDELERRLKEIEDAYKIFNRPKVIVHL